MNRSPPEGAQDERLAVGRGLGHGVGGDVAARAGAVLDHHRLVPALACPRADETKARTFMARYLDVMSSTTDFAVDRSSPEAR
jgi:hypothetical protein